MHCVPIWVLTQKSKHLRTNCGESLSAKLFPLYKSKLGRLLFKMLIFLSKISNGFDYKPVTNDRETLRSVVATLQTKPQIGGK